MKQENKPHKPNLNPNKESTPTNPLQHQKPMRDQQYDKKKHGAS